MNFCNLEPKKGSASDPEAVLGSCSFEQGGGLGADPEVHAVTWGLVGGPPRVQYWPQYCLTYSSIMSVNEGAEASSAS